MVRKTRSGTVRSINRINQWARSFRSELSRLEDRTVPATITVTGVGDSVAVDGAVTLREAVNSINGGSNVNTDVVAVGAYGTGDKIIFNSTFNSPQTINVGSDLVISKTMTITGPGSTLLTVAGSVTRVITTSAASTISGMAVTGGHADYGGGIYMAANMTLTDVVVSGNTATNTDGGGILVSTGAATLTLQKSTVSGNVAGGNGGGVFLFTNANMVATDSTVADNTALADGGGLYFFNNGSLSMSRCTVSGNNSGGLGGGIYFFATTANITNSTISGNTSAIVGGGIYGVYYADVTLKNSTVAFNSSATGGGIYSYYYSDFTLNSTIVSNNSAGSANEFFGPVNADFSLIGDAPGDATGAIITGSNNQIEIDPMLDPTLALNGAPAGTPLTHNLLVGSAAINTGDNFDGLATDERGTGFPRLQGTQADIGALETPDPAPSASATSPNVTIPGGISQTVTVTFSDLIGSKLIKQSTIATGAITITGPNGFSTTATLVPPTSPNSDAQSITATFTFTPPVNGAPGWDSTDDGVYSIHSVSGVVFDKDSPTPNSVGNGVVGKFQVLAPISYVVNATNDEAVDSDGKLSLREALANANADAGPSNITFDPSVFTGTKTITMLLGEFAISDAFGATITGPSGGVVLDAGLASRVINVDGSPLGTAIGLSNLTMTNGVSPTGFIGGGLRITNQNVTLTNVTITNCTTDVDGGAIGVLSGGSLTLTNCSLSGNTAGDTGGGISLTGASTVVVTHSTIANNQSADNGGGLYFFNGGALIVTDSTISGNKSNTTVAGLGGGGIYFYGTASTFLISNSTISGNTATGASGRGGGICMNAFGTSHAVIQNSTIAFNDAGLGGGGISQGGGTATFSSSIIAGNTVNGTVTELADLRFPFPVTVDGNNNLIGVQDPLTQGTLTGTGNLAGSVGTPLDAKLDPTLALNGAPAGSPLTHKLLAGSPALNAGNNAAALSFDQRGTGFNRTSGGQTDIGAFEVQVAAPPTVLSVVINGSGAQRSMVTSIVVTFSEAVTLPGTPATAFTLARIANPTSGPQSSQPLGNVNVAASQVGATVTLTFLGGGAVPIDLAGSLMDGTYQLTIDASKVSGAGGQLDGNANGTGGDNFQTPTVGPNRLFRLYGDADGSGLVDGIDFGLFRSAFNTNNPTFDVDGSTVVDGTDFGQFRSRFNASVP